MQLENGLLQNDGSLSALDRRGAELLKRKRQEGKKVERANRPSGEKEFIFSLALFNAT